MVHNTAHYASAWCVFCSTIIYRPSTTNNWINAHAPPLIYHYLDAVVRSGSIRKASEALAITSTALNRRILALEAELNVELFERLPKGVRLSSAGELFIDHVRKYLNEVERVKSQIADLSGERRGHISIACSQAILTSYLPKEIASYRQNHPAVTFDVSVRDREAAEQALLDRSADIALVFEPVQMADFQILFSIHQPVYALLPIDHPLADRSQLKLRECMDYPLALPTQAYGVRRLLEMSAQKSSLKLKAHIESDSFEYLRYQALTEGIITFQIEVGLPLNLKENGLIAIKLDERNVPPGILYIGQLKGRVLPVAPARFANQLIASLNNLSIP